MKSFFVVLLALGILVLGITLFQCDARFSKDKTALTFDIHKKSQLPKGLSLSNPLALETNQDRCDLKIVEQRGLVDYLEMYRLCRDENDIQWLALFLMDRRDRDRIVMKFLPSVTPFVFAEGNFVMKELRQDLPALQFYAALSQLVEKEKLILMQLRPLMNSLGEVYANEAGLIINWGTKENPQPTLEDNPNIAHERLRDLKDTKQILMYWLTNSVTSEGL